MIDDATQRSALLLGCPHEAVDIWDHGYGGARDLIHLAPFIVLIDALISTRLTHVSMSTARAPMLTEMVHMSPILTDAP